MDWYRQFICCVFATEYFNQKNLPISLRLCWPILVGGLVAVVPGTGVTLLDSVVFGRLNDKSLLLNIHENEKNIFFLDPLR